jgi:hypothetical protein
MHWSDASKNKYNAQSLIVLGLSFYFWIATSLILNQFNFQIPIGSNLKYVEPLFCLVLATLINHISFKNKDDYCKTLDLYNSFSREVIYSINVLSVVFVFCSFTISIWLA